MTDTQAEMLAALKKAQRVLSHIKDVSKADPLKYVPTSAVRAAYAAVRAAIAKAELED